MHTLFTVYSFYIKIIFNAHVRSSKHSGASACSFKYVMHIK